MAGESFWDAYRDAMTTEERIMTTIRNGWKLEFGDDGGHKRHIDSILI